MIESLGVYFLFLLALVLGWLIGSVGYGKRTTRRSIDRTFNQDYFVGLNYVLNDEPDEAIDTFINALEVNGKSVEAHLALGVLLRRRGKVDKAIKVHQDLLARPGLRVDVMDAARLALAKDYITAGLLDRGEGLLNEILEGDTDGKWLALRQLIKLYQKEQEWDKAIACVERLLKKSSLLKSGLVKDRVLLNRAAHFCCELAENAREQRATVEAREQIHRAFRFDKHNARASFILAELELESGNPELALDELHKIRKNYPQYVSELIPLYASCYTRLEQPHEFEALLETVHAEHKNVAAMLALAKLKQERSGDSRALEFLAKQLVKQPSFKGTGALLVLQSGQVEEPAKENLLVLKQALDKIMEKKPAYQCNNCGFETRKMYWSCPSCQQWETVVPIKGAIGN